MVDWKKVFGGIVTFLVGVFVASGLFFYGVVLSSPTVDCYKVCGVWLVSIPSHEQVSSFCQEKGFDYGWLNDFSCGKNQVMCHSETKIGNEDFVKNVCVDWVEK